MSSTLTLPEKSLRWGDLIDVNDPSKGKYFPLHEAQLDIYNSTARFTAAIAGTGGGKTVIGPLWIAKQIEQARKSKRPILGLVVAPTYKVLNRATVPTLIETLKGTSIEGQYKDQKGLYELADGGRIWCQGADNPGGIEGGQFDFVWGDEAGQFKYGVWIAIQGRTGAKQSPVLLTTTPYGKNWLFTEFYKKYLAGDKDYYVKQWASKENPIYPEEEYNRAKGLMRDELGRMRYDGQFTQMAGLVYPDMSNAYASLTPSELNELLLNPENKHFGGLDFGWNDPFAALGGVLDKNDVLWIWYERYLSRTTIEEHAEALPKFSHKAIKWFSEHIPENILKLRRGGHKVLKASKSIRPGIDAVNARLLSNRLRILKNRCPALIAESEIYGYDADEDNTGGDIPIGGLDHALDALRYMISGIDLRKAA